MIGAIAPPLPHLRLAVHHQPTGWTVPARPLACGMSAVPDPTRPPAPPANLPLAPFREPVIAAEVEVASAQLDGTLPAIPVRRGGMETRTIPTRNVPMTETAEPRLFPSQIVLDDPVERQRLSQSQWSVYLIQDFGTFADGPARPSEVWIPR